jgi:coenzyme Q-binding protein COQ10
MAFASEPVPINVKNVASISWQVMTNRTEHVHLKYTAAQLFDLIADVERYPEFLPWVLAAHIRRREDQTIWVDMTFGTRFLRRRFSTVGLLERPHRITITSHDPMLERFEQRWTFKTAPEGGTDIEYRVDFRFRSRLLQALIGGSFAGRAKAMAQAFTQRARQLYGAPSLSNHISS